ncbi:MAG TPA: putative lipid II flippase FtsW [Firmicutes bacterium]|nr:putative lipid II flippase FtsW [Bacillota bacterium]
MKIDKILLISTIIIISFGIIMVYSSSSIWAAYKFNDPYKFVKSQFIFFLFGLLIIKILININPSLYEKYSNKILFICFILLILVLIPGIGKIRNGSRSWFGIGSLGIQPSEFTKIGLIIYTSKYLSHNNKNIKDIKKGLLPLFLIIILFFLLIMLEPDFGTAMVIILTLVGLIFVSGPKISFFIKIGLVGLIGIVILIAIAPYRLERIVAYLNPWSDPLGSGFQIIQSLYAIGPSSLLGVGFGNSIQKNFYLPEPQTDFIFSIIAEEFGYLGIIFTISLFIIIFYRSILISLKQQDLFLKYLSFGLSFGIILQVILNILVVTGTIPTTGITCVFLSYGGSSLLVSMASIGIILSISKKL